MRTGRPVVLARVIATFDSATMNVAAPRSRPLAIPPVPNVIALANIATSTMTTSTSMRVNPREFLARTPHFARCLAARIT